MTWQRHMLWDRQRLSGIVRQYIDIIIIVTWSSVRVEGDPMVWPPDQDMFIICLFSDILSDLKPVLVLNPEKLRERFP